jgi:hypothetical protein
LPLTYIPHSVGYLGLEHVVGSGVLLGFLRAEHLLVYRLKLLFEQFDVLIQSACVLKHLVLGGRVLSMQELGFHVLTLAGCVVQIVVEFTLNRSELMDQRLLLLADCRNVLD